MKKIEFENKVSLLNINSKFVLSAYDINEIKDIINLTSDELKKQIDLNKDKYRYIFITLPEKIDKNYDLEIESSIDNWENNILLLKLSKNSDNFYIFENGNFSKLENDYISNKNSGKILVIHIESLILNLNKTQLRFRFKNLRNNEYTKYYSIDQSVKTEINKKKLNYIGSHFYTIADLNYKDYVQNLIDIGFDTSLILDSINYTFNEKEEIKLYSFIYDGKNNIDVTSSVFYGCNDPDISLNNSIINPIKLQKFKRFNINSTILYNETQYSNKINICLNPIILTDVESTFTTINFVNDPYEVHFYAKYSNQTKLDIENDNNLSILIQNGNFRYDHSNHTLIPLKENSTDKITISYQDHDFTSERVEKTYFLKIKGKKLINIVSEIQNKTLNSIDNTTTYIVKAIYSDNSIVDITNNENLVVTIFNNKENDYNYLSLNQDEASISTNNVLLDEKKQIYFSYFDENTEEIFNSINSINLLYFPSFSISGNVISSNGNSLNLINFNTNINHIDDIKLKLTNNDLSDLKKVPNIEILISKPEDSKILEFNPFEKYNILKEYFQVNVYLTDPPVCNNLLVNTINRTDINKNMHLYFRDEHVTYKLIFSTISKCKFTKFTEYCSIEINQEFNENYVVGFKDIEFLIKESIPKGRTAMEIIELNGVFETSTGYAFAKKFIFDEFHDIWLISDVPLKAVKLNAIVFLVAYLELK